MSYDIMDEVRAFKSQLDVSPLIKDTPMLSRLRNARNDDERADILLGSGYGGLKKYGSNRPSGRNKTVAYGETKGHKVGDTIRTNDFFGRVNKVVTQHEE